MATIDVKTTDKIFICGQTGSGKTELAKYVFQRMPRGIVYDIQWESKLEGLGIVVHSIEEIPPNFQKIVFQPEDDSPEYFDKFCEHVFKNHQNFVLYVEEVADLASLHDCPPGFSKMLRRGRKFGIGVMMTTQQTSNTNKLCISQSQHIICFYIFEKNHLEYVAACAGISKSEADQIRRLRPYHFWYYNQHAIQICLPIPQLK